MGPVAVFIKRTTLLDIAKANENENIISLLQAPAFRTWWQGQRLFDKDGESLQTKDSDVQLQLPANAVTKETTIRAAVSTDLAYVHSKLQLDEDEVIKSPVVEYMSCPRYTTFEKPVRIQLPHFLEPGLKPEDVNGYEIHTDTNGQCTKSKLAPKNSQQQDVEDEIQHGTYFIDKKAIIIYARHFTGYACTTCYKGKPPGLLARLYGQHTQCDTRLVKLNLYVWDRRFFIADFEQVSLLFYFLFCFT
jgi:hypothetical protein